MSAGLSHITSPITKILRAREEALKVDPTNLTEEEKRVRDHAIQTGGKVWGHLQLQDKKIIYTITPVKRNI